MKKKNKKPGLLKYIANTEVKGYKLFFLQLSITLSGAHFVLRKLFWIELYFFSFAEDQK